MSHKFHGLLVTVQQWVSAELLDRNCPRQPPRNFVRRVFWLNCGLCRERGILRTSMTRSTRCARRRSRKTFHVRVECPIVKTVQVQTF
jgi:hypothetical protein